MIEDKTQKHIDVCPGWKKELGSLDVSILHDEGQHSVLHEGDEEDGEVEGPRTEDRGLYWGLLAAASRGPRHQFI